MTLDEASQLGEAGDWGSAAELLARALEDHPSDPSLFCWLGVAERELGLSGVAHERFKACLALEPSDPHLLAVVGNALAAFDDPDAEPALRSAALLAPDLALARWAYGAYLAREGLFEQAIVELRAARDLDPDDGTAAYELGVALALSGDASGAAEAFGRAAELDPEDDWAIVVFGLALLESAGPGEALPELAAGAQARPDDVEAQLLAALAAGAEGEERLAWEMLERGRLVGATADRVLTDAVEEQLEEGPDAARAFLLGELAPTVYRERLLQRP